MQESELKAIEDKLIPPKSVREEWRNEIKRMPNGFYAVQDCPLLLSLDGLDRAEYEIAEQAKEIERLNTILEKVYDDVVDD